MQLGGGYVQSLMALVKVVVGPKTGLGLQSRICPPCWLAFKVRLLPLFPGPRFLPWITLGFRSVVLDKALFTFVFRTVATAVLFDPHGSLPTVALLVFNKSKSVRRCLAWIKPQKIAQSFLGGQVLTQNQYCSALYRFGECIRGTTQVLDGEIIKN